MLTSLFVIGLRKSDLIPVIIFCQVFAMTVICYRMEMVVPLLVLAFTVKGLVIPLLFYYLVRKTIVFEQNPSVIPVSAAIALVLVIFSASSLFAHHLHAGPFAMAASLYRAHRCPLYCLKENFCGSGGRIHRAAKRHFCLYFLLLFKIHLCNGDPPGTRRPSLDSHNDVRDSNNL